MKIKDKKHLSHEKFRKFFADLEALGFEEKNPDRIMRELRQSGWAPFLKKKFEGREKQFEKLVGLDEIFICTSFVDAINDINEHDYIWIGKKTRGNPITFFLFPILRSASNCFETAMDDVMMFIELAEKSPCCDECGEKLMLVHYAGVMHLMQYICQNSKFRHRKQNNVPYAVFDAPTLSDETSLRMFNRYQQFFEGEYRRQIAEPERKHRYARVIRAENKAKAQFLHNQKKNQFGDIKKFPDDVYYDGPHNDGEYGDK